MRISLNIGGGNVLAVFELPEKPNTVRIEMRNEDGKSIFGAINQKVVAAGGLQGE
jgi:hypothetical protein